MSQAYQGAYIILPTKHAKSVAIAPPFWERLGASVLRAWRTGYMLALGKADIGGYLPLTNLIGRAVEQVLNRYLDVCDQLAPDARALLLSELAEKADENAAYLGLLIRKRRLEGTMRGGRWYSTQAALARYRAAVVARTVPRGRPPKPA